MKQKKGIFHSLLTPLLLLCYSSAASAFNLPISLGQSFINATASGHQASFDASRAIDGYRDGASRWQSRGEESLTLDVGTASLMQGLYVWTSASSSRSYWLKVETSLDGTNWSTQIRAIPTKKNPNRWPVYLPMTHSNKSIRHVRISGYGNNLSSHNRITEVRWLAEGSTISNHPQVAHAHWYYENKSYTPKSLEKTGYPHLFSWSTENTNYLSAFAAKTGLQYDRTCPRYDATTLPPNLLVIDNTGQMDQFLTIKSKASIGHIYMLDWSHVDLDASATASFVYPEAEMTSIAIDIETEVGAFGSNSTRVPDQWTFPTVPLFCTGRGLGFWNLHDPDTAFDVYWQAESTGANTAEISANWDEPVPSLPVNNFSVPASYGLAFAQISEFTENEGTNRQFATDGFLDTNSHWATGKSKSGQLILSSGPGTTSAPSIKGAFVWTHQSNTRQADLSLSIRKDGEVFANILPTTTLPSTPNRKPVFIPIEVGNHKEIKHISVTLSDSSSTIKPRLTEIRYSDSTTPPPGVTVLQPTPLHALRGNAFHSASYTLDDPSSYVDPLRPISNILDGSAANLSYFAANGPVTLNLELASDQYVTAINLWMHLSHTRSSQVDGEGGEFWHGNNDHSYTSFSAPLPVSPRLVPIRIELSNPDYYNYFYLSFNGNSANNWNSIAEVSWE